jgi:adenylate cyclase
LNEAGREVLEKSLIFASENDHFWAPGGATALAIQVRSRQMRLLFGDCALDPARRELCRSGEAVHIEPQVFDLLLHLIENRDHVVSKDDLLSAVWQGRIVSESTLSNRINAARSAIGDSGERQQLIRTVARKGLRFVGEVKQEPAESKKPDDPIDGVSDGRPAIAVLPFANMSGDSEQEYFADGLTEDIITDLSRVSALFVVARNSVFTFKGRAIRIQEAARALNVRYVLEGSVRKAVGRVRITAQLVDGHTGGHLWAERYDRALDDIFSLQDEISRSIVDALKVRLLPAEVATLASRPTTNVEAYQYYLMGRSHFLSGGRSQRALRLGRQMFCKAIEIDPRYARAYAGLANCDSYLLCLGDLDATFEEILAHSERALGLEPLLPEAHAARGLALYMSGRHGEADIVLERAMQLGPDLFEAHYFAARNHQARGQHEKAAALFERASRIEPGDFLSLGLAVATYRSLGRNEDMRSAAQRCLERAEAEIAAHPDNAGALAFGASVQAELGDKAVAETWAARAAALDPANAITNYNVACAYAALGKFDAALSHLQQVFASPSTNWRSHLEWMKHDSSIDPLRSHSGYSALLERLEAEAEIDPLARRLEHRPAIAVLPFENLSDDPEQEYFADGITEDIITLMSKHRSFFVIARNSTFAFKGPGTDVRRVGMDLGADYVVEGSVRKVGQHVRITAQLIETRGGRHLWAERYDRSFEDIFNVQDEITATIAARIEPEVGTAERLRAERKPPQSLHAWDYFHLGTKQFYKSTAEGNRDAQRLFRRAIELDPQLARAYAWLSYAIVLSMVYFDADPDEERLNEAVAAAEKGVELDDQDGLVRFMSGRALLARRSYGDALAELELAVDLNPALAVAYCGLGDSLAYEGRFGEAIPYFERAINLSNHDPQRWAFYAYRALAHLFAQEFEQALEWAQKATRIPNCHYWPFAHRVSALGHLQRGKELQVAVAELLQRKPGFSCEFACKRLFYVKNSAHLDVYVEGLRRAGLPE